MDLSTASVLKHAAKRYPSYVASLIPETEREKRYYRWYELSVLYSEAVRKGIDQKEISATKLMTDDAWNAYLETISDLNGPRSE